ncbi:thioredoxin domain-containing protein [Actinomadura meridiana]|uniref:Thioredoxin domain-containing protein n=1 Tax=Actinomadura meridiana TaxID=559626 RepID=A0ABP8CKE6_9ACTN
MALVTVLGAALTGCGESGGKGEAAEPSKSRPSTVAYADLTKVPESLAQDGTTIIVGNPAALVMVHLFEDPRCPVCKEYESTGGPVLSDWIVRGKARADYTLASFLDDRVGGGGSKRAVNALRAALEQRKFAEYHAVLYRYQPEESVDGFTTERLLELAEKVDGLRGAAFDNAVKKMKYRKFVAASQEVYRKSGKGKDEPRGPGTPTAEINGVRIPVDYSGVLYDKDAFAAMLTRAYKLMDSSS